MAELFDSYVKLLLHFDGEDAATTDIDYSGHNHILTFTADAQLDTAQKKFGISSALFDGTADLVSIPDSADWAFGAGDFTIDFWVYANNADVGLFGHGVGNARYEIFSAGAGGDMIYLCNNTVGGTAVEMNGGTISTGVWVHIAIERYGSTFTFFVDGTAIDTAIYAGTIADPVGVFVIGRSGETADYTNGWIDEFRISKGIGRYKGGNFTPLTYAYQKIARQINS